MTGQFSFRCSMRAEMCRHRMNMMNEASDEHCQASANHLARADAAIFKIVIERKNRVVSTSTWGCEFQFRRTLPPPPTSASVTPRFQATRTLSTETRIQLSLSLGPVGFPRTYLPGGCYPLCTCRVVLSGSCQLPCSSRVHTWQFSPVGGR